VRIDYGLPHRTIISGVRYSAAGGFLLMDPNFPHAPHPTNGPLFPSLPIVTPDPPRRSESEKYGDSTTSGRSPGREPGVGCLFCIWAWSLRAVWSNIYVLHDREAPEAARVQAAYALSRDLRVNQRQYWDMCLRTPLPPLARYLLAEALTAEAASSDPRGYAAIVARSPDWPDWLRLLLTRPMAYAAINGVVFPRESIDILAHHEDPAIALLADFVLANGTIADSDAVQRLARNAGSRAKTGSSRACSNVPIDSRAIPRTRNASSTKPRFGSARITRTPPRSGPGGSSKETA